MRDYSKSKIYKIEPVSNGDVGDVYFGSTTEKYLSQRFACHRKDYKRWIEGKSNKITSFFLFDKYGLPNCHIVLIENVENCKSKDDLHAREAFYIRNNECVNRCIPLRTQRENHKEWREKNKEHVKELKKQYRLKNLDSVKEKAKQYREDHKQEMKEKGHIRYVANKEEIKAKHKEYRQEHAEELKAKASEKHPCECGVFYSQRHKSRHCKTKKHQGFLCNINV